MRLLRVVRWRLGAAATAALVGCFSEAGDVAPAGTSSDGTGADTASVGSSSGGPLTTTTQADVTGGSSSSSGSESSAPMESSSSAEEGSSSTGEAPLDCECPVGAVVCEGFEGAGIPAGWTLQSGSDSPDAAPSIEAAYCGEQSFPAAITGDGYTMLNTEPEFALVSEGPVSVSFRFRITDGCLDASTRAFAVSLLDGSALDYQVSVLVGGDEGIALQFNTSENQGAPNGLDLPALTPGQWHRLRLDFDGLAALATPNIFVAFDGAEAIDAPAGPQIPDAGYDEIRLSAGPYRLNTGVEGGCEIAYDDVWLFSPR
ncbi:MAG: hypothetical protein JNK45_38290 [Myxococcales bacterium]|nr:hypothetical protein [Myxococcales bacterium]